MAVPASLLRKIDRSPPHEAWKEIFSFAWSVYSGPLTEQNAISEVSAREREIAPLDLMIGTAAWDLWFSYYDVVERTSQSLIDWWRTQQNGCAVLILDALSLREVPWIIHGAQIRGYSVAAKVTGSELPGITNSFAKALGFASRSSLSNNKPGNAHHLKGATTDSSDNNWDDCAKRIGSEPKWILWHHWPDNCLHRLTEQTGRGLADLTRETTRELNHPAFWDLIHRLTTGRSLVITADHGYAVTELFSDCDSEQTNYLRTQFSNQRYAVVSDTEQAPNWMPPIDLQLSNLHGTHRFVVGRRKWKGHGGYPSLSHGGLSLGEVAVPFVELTR